MKSAELIRSSIFHTTANAFHDEEALVALEDGGLLIYDGRIADSGDFSNLRASHPQVAVTDWRGGYVLPGLVDTHVHFPQVRVLGRLGWSLLDWLEHAALPEERKMADVAYAQHTAKQFCHALASHGTTTACVFGAHFAPAVAELFEAADAAGVRVATGLILSDRLLSPELHIAPETAYRESRELIRRFHGHGNLLYSVTPRFALSTTEMMLEVCQTLLTEDPTLRFQSHLNEQVDEVAAVARQFRWASDYLAVYERYGLTGRRAIMAHNVQTTASELERLAATGATIAHCPASNAALGSGIFPLRRHVHAGVRCALGTDVGGGTGFGMLKEGLQTYLMQRVAPEPMVLTAAQLLYLATRAGAGALGLEDTTGDFSAGKAADLVYLRPPADSVLAEVLCGVSTLPEALAALFTLAGQESVREVRVNGAVVYQSSES
jgi:guanine deaminase